MIGYIPTIPEAPVGGWDALAAFATLGLLFVLGVAYLIRTGTRPGTRH